MPASTADADAPRAGGSEPPGERVASEVPAAEERTPLLSLDGFSGPLERLLTLARAHQVDLTQLSLAALIEQLVGALRHAPPATPLGEKGDWVVMVAWLVQLRSVLLLPPDAPARQDATVAADRLRARLIELQATQALAAWLRQRPQLGRDTFARGRPELLGVASETATLDVIEFLWSSLALFDDDIPETDAVPVYQPRRFALHTIAAARERIRLRLAAAPEGGPLERFLPDAATIAASGAPQALQRRSAWASTFAASLELARHGDVAVAQQAFLAPVHLSAAAHANRPPMSKTQTAPPAGFTPGERDYIRRELDMFFSTLP